MKVEAVQSRTVKVLAQIQISLFGLNQSISLFSAEEAMLSILTTASAAAAQLCLFPVNNFLHYV